MNQIYIFLGILLVVVYVFSVVLFATIGDNNKPATDKDKFITGIILVAGVVLFNLVLIIFG